MNTRNIITSFLISSLFLVSVCLGAEKSTEQKLYEAVQFQDLPKVKELLAKGANPNQFEGDRPLLGWAAQGGNVEIVKALLEAKANVDAVDLGFKETPLLRAIENQHVEVVKELLKAKANPNAKDALGEPCLARAVKGDKPEITGALVEAGAEVSYISPDGDTLVLLATQANTSASVEVIKILAKAKADLNHSNLVYTPLVYAAELGNKELVKALLEGGADPNGKTDGGRTPLYAAIKDVEIATLLLEAKADPNLASTGASPILIAAIENGTPEAVKALLEAGANVNISDDRGNTALQLAQNYAKTDIADLLKKHGATE